MQITLWRVVDEYIKVISEGAVLDSVYGYITVNNFYGETIYSGEIQHFEAEGYELETKTITLYW